LDDCTLNYLVFIPLSLALIFMGISFYFYHQTSKLFKKMEEDYGRDENKTTSE